MKGVNSAVDGELIEFHAEDKALLHGFLMRPKYANTCLIWVHGMTGNFYRSSIPMALAKKLGNIGVAVFSINTRGHDLLSGTRFDSKKRDPKVIGTSLENFEESVFDISGAINAMKEKGFKRFILSGGSTGCQKITYYQYKRKDPRVKGLVLLAPVDDYHSQKAELKKRFDKIVKMAKTLKSSRKSRVVLDDLNYLGVYRFLSVADTRNVEARLFNYDGPMTEFSSIKVPIYASFGSKEEYEVKPVHECIEILSKKTQSKSFSFSIIDGAAHSYRGFENNVASSIELWLLNILNS